MTPYFAPKYLHVPGAAVLLGAGGGSAALMMLDN